MSDWFEKLNAFADGELNSVDAEKLQIEISNSPELKRQYDSIVQLKQTLKAKLPLHDSPELFAKCQSRWREMDRVKRNSPEGFIGRMRYGLASLVAAAILFAGLYNRMNPATESGVDNLSQTLTASASTSFGFLGRPENAAYEWAGQQLGGQVPAPQVEERGLKLLQADIVNCRSERIARFLYTDGRVNYVLTAFPIHCEEIQELIGDNGWMRGTNGQLNFVSRVVGDYLFVATAPRSFVELESLLQRIR
ncbi:MAG: hypothetical protein U0R49_07690 [Fimbriimonadales bacterium]